MNPHRTITRYTGFSAFLSTIENGLFLSKAALFKDELEGILPYFRDTEDNHVISRDDIRACLDWIYVSCWHTEPHECHAMWQIYGASSEAVAIQTTEIELRVAYIRSKLGMHSYLDMVNYKNPDSEDIKKPSPVTVFINKTPTCIDSKAVYAALFSFMKHLGYSYERELRLVAIDKVAECSKKNPLFGVHLSPEATRLMIKRIIIHPSASLWFEDLVKNIVRNRYDLDIEIVRSTLAENANKGLQPTPKTLARFRVG